MYAPGLVVCVSLSMLWEAKLNFLVPDLSLACCIPIAMALAPMCKSMCHFWAVVRVQRLRCPHCVSVLKAEEGLHVHKLLHAKSSLPHKKILAAWEIGWLELWDAHGTHIHGILDTFLVACCLSWPCVLWRKDYCTLKFWPSNQLKVAWSSPEWGTQQRWLLWLPMQMKMAEVRVRFEDKGTF